MINKEIALTLNPVKNVAILKNKIDNVIIIFLPYVSASIHTGDCIILYIVHMPVNAQPAWISDIPRSPVILTRSVDGVTRMMKIINHANKISRIELFDTYSSASGIER